MTSAEHVMEEGSGSVELGARIKQFRLGRKLTQRQVAEFAEVSVSFLSQLERGVCGASVPTLSMIAKALGLSVADLFSDDPASSHRVLRRGERPQIKTASGAMKFMLTRRPLQNLEVLEGVMAPGGSIGSSTHSHGDSQELLLVLAGLVRLTLDDIEYELGEGDSIEYRSSSTHGVDNVGETEARVLWVISPPSL
ncbi:XRE family transcriptional regulator [Mycolicibacterium sp. 050158]|jgi:transcriptional regulator with XRE-family HTH domain|uniref:helix-turn-helix domain-containing protein n=1 Tax=Mycolicibacterium sp. 050158 TaxID=3090602 RepID=UPI00299E290E|nr:XRE family transcriptional regulator [Mycolicibacterium sp. 050158]MDX1889668.1 XRE family transcriptional regulator [Mycolicibacterium sp. 050158]